MTAKQRIKPTNAELEILRILWENGPGTVRFVNDVLNKQKPVGYTTTLKIMQIMTDKGILKRNTDNRTHIYEHLIAQQETRQQLIDRLLDQAFGGSAHKMVMQALGTGNSSKKELEEIKALIEKLEGGQP